MLAAYDPSIAQRPAARVCDRAKRPERFGLSQAEAFWYLDAWRLCPCENGEMHTYVCGNGSDVVAVRSAVDREAEDASRGQKEKHKNSDETGDLHRYTV